MSSDLGPIPTGWKQETEKDKAEVIANANTRLHYKYKYKYAVYQKYKYKVAALEATMCSTVPLEDLYKRRFELEVKTFYVFIQGLEGQEAGSVGQVEEGHGEGGGCQ